MKRLKLTPFIILLSVSSCFTQPSAPIEYNNSARMEQKRVQKPAEQRIKYSNSTESAIPTEEPIHSLQVKATNNFETVTFQEGDSLNQLASDFAVSENALIIANRLEPNEVIRPGRKLIIPKVVTHIVKENENLEMIAEEFNQDLPLLARLNNVNPPYRVNAGVVIEIIVEPDLRAANNKVVARNINAQELPKESREVTLIPKKAPTFIMPAQGKLKKKFREAEGIKKEGIIITASLNTPVKAVADGQVTFSGNKPESFGNFIIIKHTNNSLSAYAHLNNVKVNKNRLVKKGDIIGNVGKTGNATEPELYFALKVDGKPVDPIKYTNLE
ncbi:MAG: uncharacterized protein K0Q51_303 [Rickettsiaceae bacterium]|nr:uncharacterized protein [Rickettsiaceae bacterium]